MICLGIELEGIELEGLELEGTGLRIVTMWKYLNSNCFFEDMGRRERGGAPGRTRSNPENVRKQGNTRIYSILIMCHVVARMCEIHKDF